MKLQVAGLPGTWLKRCALAQLTYFRAGRNELALPAFQTTLELSPDLVRGHYYKSLALLEQGDLAAALTEAKLETSESWRLATLAVIYHALGRNADSESALDDLVPRFADPDATALAQVHAFRGEIDPAFEWLDRAYEQHEPFVAWVRTDNLLKNLQSDPRFSDFLERLNLAD